MGKLEPKIFFYSKKRFHRVFESTEIFKDEVITEIFKAQIQIIYPNGENILLTPTKKWIRNNYFSETIIKVSEKFLFMEL